MHWKVLGLCFAVALVAPLVTGCGDDTPDMPLDTGAPSGPSAGDPPTSSNVEPSRCDATAQPAATCGGTPCPELSDFQQRLCLLSCCAGQRCGVRNTAEAADNDCHPL